jgi:uncharacterized protein YabN with tetrapyrrole methylase and pyrophosphatase domain
MNIPESVKIGGHYLSVNVTNNNESLTDNEIGKTWLGKNAIYLNSNYPKSRQEESLLHEIIHNCLFDLQEEQDEKMVERLGTILYQVIIDNPEIFKN